MNWLPAIGIPLGFSYPWVLLALLLLPIIWWLLRLTPPRPASEPFPPTKILAKIINRDETPARSPWWLTLLRLLMATLAIFAMALPQWNPQNASLKGDGPLLLVMDNGWASGANWREHIDSASAIVEEAKLANRPIIAFTTIEANPRQIEITAHDKLQKQIASWENYPIQPDFEETVLRVREAIKEFTPTSLVFLSEGVRYNGYEQLAAEFRKLDGQKILFLPESKNTIAINSVNNEPDAMVGEVVRLDSARPEIYRLIALDNKGLSVSKQHVAFETGETQFQFRFEIPVELRNDITRIIIENVHNAGANQLLDESNRRRLVGLVSGEKHDNSQPLLSPLYYISRALEPFSDIRRADNANVARAIPDLITRGVSAIILADIGLLAPETSSALEKWIKRGGMLVRFAGPRLAATSNNTLLPVAIREGNRSIGGALSWETPKPVADFERSSPFFGLQPPRNVFVNRQVLALQDGELAQKTWARLSDGTPLVTAKRNGNGWLILVHVSSDASWSNLPLSGTFVEMLRRIINQSHSNLSVTSHATTTSLPPLQVLNAKGQLGAPDISAKPANFNANIKPRASVINPPGYYGTSDGFRAINLFTGDADISALELDDFGKNVTLANYGVQNSLPLKPWALALLALFLALDCIAVLWMAGALRFLKINGIQTGHTSPAIIIALASILMLSLIAPGNAQEKIQDDIDFSPALKTRLAYVITGIASVDEVSEAGLRGLTHFLTTRTAIEPGEPIGVNIAVDELAFYPIIYWPIHTASELPDASTMARIDTYMKQGGSVLFDTRDQISGFFGGTATSPQALHLQDILANLDIPPLEPVPTDHVLTKSFFILAQFPGRYSGGELWVEQSVQAKEFESRPVRAGDGVSSIMITSNDFAGAWAINRRSQPMFAIVPPNPIQRELAFRVGVNLVMYAMTGNYKSDQVHIPALLERLGQ